MSKPGHRSQATAWAASFEADIPKQVGQEGNARDCRHQEGDGADGEQHRQASKHQEVTGFRDVVGVVGSLHEGFHAGRRRPECCQDRDGSTHLEAAVGIGDDVFELRGDDAGGIAGQGIGDVLDLVLEPHGILNQRVYRHRGDGGGKDRQERAVGECACQ